MLKRIASWPWSTIIVTLFVLLAVMHYASARPLWLDETFIHDNIKKHSYSGLFHPLEPSQSFPRGYLIAIKALSTSFNFHVLAERFLPFLAMLSAVLVWWRLYRRENDHENMIFALLAFCCSYRLVYYAAELKQYSMDVLVMGLTCVLLFHLAKASKVEIKDYALVMIYPLFMFVSYTAVFACWMIVFQIMVRAVKEKEWRVLTLLSLLVTVVILWLSYQYDLRFARHTSALLAYWEGYQINTESVVTIVGTTFEGLRRLAAYWYGPDKIHLRLATVFIPFFMYGLFYQGWVSWMQEKGRVASINTVGMFLLIQIFMLSVFQIFPFTGERITLFLAPIILWATVSGLRAIPFKPLRIIMLVYFIFCCLFSLSGTLRVLINFY